LITKTIESFVAAEPFFANTETIVRLDQSDAAYVDVIHSDIAYFVSGGFGLKQKIGHVDFYPNGEHAEVSSLTSLSSDIL
jgi:Lipase